MGVKALQSSQETNAPSLTSSTGGAAAINADQHAHAFEPINARVERRGEMKCRRSSMPPTAVR